MWTSRLTHRFLRVGLLSIVVAAMCWSTSPIVETADLETDPTERPPMFVLQVGVGRYLHTKSWAMLTGSANDVDEMRKVLESERYKVPTQNIVTLRDNEATKANIFEKFRSHLIANARTHFEKTRQRDAVVMFQFSGHGSQVPDVDGDEKDDHKDETLVTYDSEDAPGKNFDITDDEIFALTSELRQYTDNIVYVFDSCHSGSGTRDSDDVRRLPERKTVPEVVAGVGVNATRSGEKKPADDPGTGVLPPGDDYIVITAARSGELASQRNCFEECGSATRPLSFGNLSFYLIDELKRARSDTSYRELMDNVRRRVVAEKPTQTPQIEGDSSRFVFSGLGSKEDSFASIVEGEPKPAKPKRTVTIAAGAMQGVTPGTLVWFYDKSVSRFATAAKISSGMVRSVTAGAAVVELIAPKRSISTNDKARIVAADLGSLTIKLNLERDAAAFTPTQKGIVDRIRGALLPARNNEKPPAVIVPAPQMIAAGSWDVAVLKDKFRIVAAKVKGGITSCESASGSPTDDPTPPDREVFYLAGKDFVPLYRFCIDGMPTVTSDESAIAQRISDVLVHIARLRSVSAIANTSSPLAGKINVQPVKLNQPYSCREGKFAAESEPVAADTGTGYYPFAPRQAFWFVVTNNSPVDVYVAVLNLAPDGSVKIISPRSRDDEQYGIVIPKNGGRRILTGDDCRVDAAGNFLEAGARRAAAIPGLDDFKFIFSVDLLTREKLQFLEMSAVTPERGDSPIAGASDWTTVETIFQINDTGK